MSKDASKNAEEQIDRAIFDALRRRADSSVSSEADDDALISAAVGAHLESVESSQTDKNVTLGLAVGGLLAAAAAVALWLVPADPGDGSRHATATQADASAATQAMWVLEDEGTPLEGFVTSADRETCGTRDDARACLEPGSRGSFEADGNLELEEGSAQVEAEGPIVVFLAGVRVQAATDSANFNATRRARSWTVSVDSGTVTLTKPDGASQVLEAGESTGNEAPAPAKPPVEPAAEDSESSEAGNTAGASQRRAPTPSIDELLERARKQRAAKDFAASAQTYEQLLRTYPNSSKARATLVSLAQLYQGPLDDPAKALRHFDRYLERGGPLAEEAHYGRIRALRSLGRGAVAKAEVEAFLRAYPNSAYADALRD